MGMDVYGRKPKNEKGEYFRNSVWYWHPLWDYCLKMHPKIAEKCKDGHSNSGDGLNASDAKRLANVIKKDLESGEAQLYHDMYLRYQALLPKEVCSICQGTKIHKYKSVNNGLAIEEERICNNCDEKGMRESWMKNYPFSLDNLKEWQEFLDNCGGFNIY